MMKFNCIIIAIILILSFSPVLEAEIVTRREKQRTNAESDVNDRKSETLYKRCPPCRAALPAEAGSSKKSKLSMGFTAVVRSAIDSMWTNDYREAFACACHHLSTHMNDGFAQAILHSLSLSKIASNILPRKYSAPTAPASAIKGWEILGPINVGKLEVDADTTFSSSRLSSTREEVTGTVSDVALYILQLPSNATVFSDLMPAGTVSWQYMKVGKTGEIDLHFGTAWNEVVQGVSSSAAYEYQGWARAVTYVKANGVYSITCAGAHTVYVRNDNTTRLLIGDVYKSGQIIAPVDLKAGLVGLVVPLRGLAQGSLYCQLNAMASESIVVYPPRFLPDAVEFADSATKGGAGLLLTTVFALPVQNAQSHSITLEYRLDKPMGFDGDFIVREVRHPVMQDNTLLSNSNHQKGENKKRFGSGSGSTFSPSSDKSYGEETQTILSAGQTALLTLEISSVAAPNVPLHVPCRKSKPFTLTVLPGRGDPVKIQFEFQCRHFNQSFHISYVDHDNTVTQAAVVLPYAYHSPQFAKHAKGSDTATGSRRKYSNLPKKTCKVNGQCDNISKDWVAPITYPILLTLHGSGIAPSNHADSHKFMHPLKKGDYLFGLEKYFVLAPTRFGAHNWEAVGDLSAWWSVSALKRAFDKVRLEYNVSLPLVSTEFAMVSGHSMGGHGAWMNAVNHPDTYACIAPAAGWIRKEEYSNGNSFFHLDIHNSYVESSLIAIMMDAMSEFHADRFASNLVLNDVHIRVGSVDRTVHPWYSRRMHRLLVESNVNSSIEELLGKQHWWWDTWKENDGGVLNDNKMRDFYDHCFASSNSQQESTLNFINFALSHTSASSVSSEGLYNLWLQNQTSYRKESSPISGKPGVKLSNNLSTKRKQKARINDTDLFATPSADAASEEESESGRPYWMMHRCHRENLTLSVTNPAMHSGLCGLRVLQQFRLFSMSKVRLSCAALGFESVENEKSCHVHTHNVRRLAVDVGFKSAFFGVSQVVVDGALFHIAPAKVPGIDNYITSSSSWRPDSVALSVNESTIASLVVEFCWKEPQGEALQPLPPYLCDRKIDPIREKNLVNYGPFRGLYSRPFHIVYGTPSNQAVRIAMKDLAVYLGNAHFAAHGTRVKVLSDLEYRAGNYIKAIALANILFIGGPTHNKLLKAANSSFDLSEEDASKTLLAFVPTDLSFPSTATSFSLRDHAFNASDESIIFTMPISRWQSPPSPSSSFVAAMGGCIHANSAEGYLHVSRLAWPVVPPMVRAPFANYIPDLMVIDSDIWALGLGAVKAAGFWDTEWKLSKTQLYTRF